MGLARDRAGEQGLAGTRRPGHEYPARPPGPGPVIADGVAEIIHHLADLSLDLGIAGHIGEPGDRPLGVDDPRLSFGQAGQAAGAAEAGGVPADTADSEVEQAADEQQRQQQPGRQRQR